MPIDYLPREETPREEAERQKDKEIRNPFIRAMIRVAIGAAILIFILVSAWWLFFRSEDTNQVTDETTDTNKQQVREVMLQAVIDKFSGPEYGYKFEKQNDVGGFENHLGMKGTDFIQIFSTDGVVAQASYNFTVEGEKISQTQIDQAVEFSGFMTDSRIADWVQEQIVNVDPFRTYSSEPPVYDGSMYGYRLRCESLVYKNLCNITLAYGREITDF